MGSRGSRLYRWLGIAGCLAATSGFAQLTDPEKQGIADALFLGNMTVANLSFERKIFKDPYRLGLVDLGLDEPLKAADEIMRQHETARATPMSQIADTACRMLWPASAPGTPSQPTISVPPNVPAELRKPVISLIGQIQRANGEIRAALAGITPEEKRALIDGLPALVCEEPGVTFDFVRGTPLGKDALLGILKKVDTARISRAGADLCLAIERATPILRQYSGALSGAAIDFRVEDISVRLAGTGSDSHGGTPPNLLIDLGGNDRYEGRVGAGIGFASVLIDLGGDDTVRTADLSTGCGLLGIGIAKFGGGSSTFVCGSLSLGAGLAGFGAFGKEGAADLYQSKALAQGFGMFGIGLMIDNAGDDSYRLAYMGQGAGRTRGVGWLIDRRGADTYRAGGLVPNSPLFKDISYSFAQGFGSGYREDTGGQSGGIGLLSDFAGDDSYISDTYAQAASYWFALGSLYDAGGNDLYTGHHYVQSSAMHLTAAYLFDLAGEDGYLTRFGACHAIGHDYGVAFMVDRAGNDVFASQDSSPGTGNANGVGIFLDAAGDDRYSAAPGLGNAARGSGSIGLFVDLTGTDKYREGLADGGASVGTTWGMALDRATLPSDTPPSPTEAEWPKPGSAPMRSEAEMAKLFARASQWGVGTAQADTERALRELVAIGVPAWEWMLTKHAATADNLQVRAFSVVLGQIGAPARRVLADRLEPATGNLAINLMRIATLDRTREAGPAVAQKLKNPDLLRAAVRAAGACGGEECVRELLPLAIDEDRVVASSAVIALADIGSETAYSTAEALVQSSDILVRRAAIRLMAGFPNRALTTAKRLLGTNEEPAMRLGLELISAIGTPDALNEACKYLTSGYPGVKIQALLALAGRCPADSVAVFRNARADPNPLVKALASRLVPTR